MRWNEMTAREIVEAKEKCGGVCILPMGCIERHGSHLPTGIDYMMAWHFSDLAAQLEPVMVFPPWYFGGLSSCSFAPGPGHHRFPAGSLRTGAGSGLFGNRPQRL